LKKGEFEMSSVLMYGEYYYPFESIVRKTNQKEVKRMNNGIKKVKLGMVAFVVLLATLSLASCASAKTWYVDDEGRADFTKIQDAINAASSRDTIVVRDGTYTENIHVNKPLTIRSENGAEATIVQSAWPRHVFMITTDNVNISGFTIKGASNNWFDKNVNVCGIFLKYVDHCNISDNIISNKYRGIQLMYSTKNILSNNIVNSNTHFGIGLYYSSNYNTLTNNTISSIVSIPKTQTKFISGFNLGI